MSELTDTVMNTAREQEVSGIVLEPGERQDAVDPDVLGIRALLQEGSFLRNKPYSAMGADDFAKARELLCGTFLGRHASEYSGVNDPRFFRTFAHVYDFYKNKVSKSEQNPAQSE